VNGIAMKQKPQTTKKPAPKGLDIRTLDDTPPWEWPSEAAAFFKTVLTDSTAPLADRLIAAHLAGDYVAINDELAEILMAVLGSKSEPEELRAQAATSFGPGLETCYLGDFNDPEDPPRLSEKTFEKIKRLLHLLYHEDSVPKLVRRRILEASVRAHEKWHQDAIKRAYNSKDPEWMLTAVFCMRYAKGFEKEILQSLQSRDPLIHVDAVAAAGAEEVDAAWEHIYELLEDAATTPKPLLLAAIIAIANIRQDTPSLEILNHLVESEDEDVSEAADEALAFAGAYTEFNEDDELDDAGDASGWIN
jgi:hypothetical protein